MRGPVKNKGAIGTGFARLPVRQSVAAASRVLCTAELAKEVKSSLTLFNPPRSISMKAIWNGIVVAQSEDTVLVEGNHYFPEASLNRQYVTFSNHRSTCPWKGQASYYSLLVNGEMNTDAAWTYPDPKPEAEEIRGRVAFWKGVKIEP
jgi:uncharacterized protein (DUF427 family)